MIVGIGIDIIEISRIKKAVERTERFLYRNFSEREIDYFKAKSYKAESIAGSFAAKEALSKAIGTGFRGFSLEDIEILRDELGKPYIEFSEKVSTVLNERGLKNIKIHLSISHNKENSIANVIIEN